MPWSVAEHCQQKQLTLEELVERTGIDENRVRAIFLGRWLPSPEDRKKIAEVLDVAVEEIRWGHTTPIQHIYGHGPG